MAGAQQNGDVSRPLLDETRACGDPVTVDIEEATGANCNLQHEAAALHRTEQEQQDYEDEHKHYSDRGQWLRAGVLGANDGLVSVTATMLGVSGGSPEIRTLILAGCSALVAGALSMAAGEYISVSSQRDTEQADIQKEREQQEKGPEARLHELNELADIWKGRGLDDDLAHQVAIQLTKHDVVRAHARDELGIDMDELSNPWAAALSSMISFTVGAGVPLIAAIFVLDPFWRLISVSAAATAALLSFGVISAWLGGAHKIKASLRVLIGGWIAMAVTFGVGKLFGQSPE